MGNSRAQPSAAGVRVAFLDSEEAEWKFFREDRCDGCKKAKLHECTQPEDPDGERRRGCYGCTTLANKPVPCSLITPQEAENSRSPSPLSEDEWTRKHVAREGYGRNSKKEAAKLAAKGTWSFGSQLCSDSNRVLSHFSTPENKYVPTASRSSPPKQVSIYPAPRPAGIRNMQNMSSYPVRRRSPATSGGGSSAEDIHQLRAIVIARERRLETAQRALDELMQEVQRAQEEVARRAEELNEAKLELVMEERQRR